MGLAGLPDNPCHGCTERTARCHAECGKYREWNKLARKRREMIRQKRLMEGALVENQARRRDKAALVWRKRGGLK